MRKQERATYHPASKTQKDTAPNLAEESKGEKSGPVIK
jgi:hypothetical protein